MTRILGGCLMVAVHVLTAAAQPPSGVVAGRVVDARTGQPLAGVLVRVDHQPVVLESDTAGAFRLELPLGSHTIAVSLIGYTEVRRAVTVSAGAPLELLVELPEGAGPYEELVTVTASARHESHAAPAGALLHGRDLQALRGVMLDDPLRAVQSLPAATSTDDFYSEFAVRGSGFRHVGLSLDGVPSPYLIHAIHGVTDGGSIAMVNSEALGAAALLPGSYTQRTGRRLGAHVELTGTSANLIVEGPLAGGRGDWLVSARRSYLDYLLARIDPEGSFGFGFSDGLVRTTIDLNHRHQLQLLGVLGRSVFDEEPEDLGVNDEAVATSHAWLSSGAWRFTPSARFSIVNRVYGTGMNFRNVNGAGALLDRGLESVLGWRTDAMTALPRGWLLEAGGDVQRTSATGRRHRTFDGASEPRLLADYRAAAPAMSAYAQLTTRFGSLSLTPGGRVDRWQATATTTASPWITGELALTGTTRLRGGAGVYRQFPELSYLYGLGGNRQLDPERAVHTDLGLSQTFRGGVTAQLTAFARDERDVLRAVGAEPRRLPDGSIELGRGDAIWANRLTGRARGVEAVMRRDAPTGVSGWLAYGYARHRYEDAMSGEHFWSDYDQRHTLSAFVSTRLSNRTSVGAKFRYGSNYPITGYVGERPIAPQAPPLFGGMRPLFLGLVAERNTLRLPPYVRLDVRADRAVTWGGRRVTLFVEVANALNRRNERNVPYSVERTGLVSGVTDSLLPIVPSAGFVIEF